MSKTVAEPEKLTFQEKVALYNGNSSDSTPENDENASAPAPKDNAQEAASTTEEQKSESTSDDGEKAAEEVKKADDEGEKADDESEKSTDEGEKAADEGEKAADEGEKSTDEGEKSTDDGEKSTDEGEKAADEGEKAADEGEKSSAPAEEKTEAAAEKTAEAKPESRHAFLKRNYVDNYKNKASETPGEVKEVVEEKKAEKGTDSGEKPGEKAGEGGEKPGEKAAEGGEKPGEKAAEGSDKADDKDAEEKVEEKAEEAAEEKDEDKSNGEVIGDMISDMVKSDEMSKILDDMNKSDSSSESKDEGGEKEGEKEGEEEAVEKATEEAKEKAVEEATEEAKEEAAEESTDEAKEEDKKEGFDKEAVIKGSLETVSGAVGTYKDYESAQKDAEMGKVGEKHSNNLNIAADAFDTASSGLGVAKEISGEDHVGTAADFASGVGNVLKMSANADKVRRQNSSISKMKARSKKGEGDAATKDDKKRKKAADQYMDFTRAGRYESGFNTGASVLDTITSGLTIAGDFLGKDSPFAKIMGVLGPLLGLISKGLSAIGSKLAQKETTSKRKETVENYISKKAEKIDGNDDKLTGSEKENIVIARLGVNVDDIGGSSKKETMQKDIFNAICKKRAAVIKVDPGMMEDMGIDPKNPNKEKAILEALGYEE